MNERVKTRVFLVDAQQPESSIMDTAAACLRGGGLVAFPTETVYGLGANALDAAAVSRIYTAKGRPPNNPLIVHIAAHEQLDEVAVEIPPVAHDLATHFWPGALTLVLKRHGSVAANVSAGRDTVAVRVPDHPIAQALIRAAAVPVAAPSANRFTRPSATTAQHVLDDLDGQVDIVLDGGPTLIGLESTVLDLTGSFPTILRPGGVTVEALRPYLPRVELHSAMIALDDSDAALRSPGMLQKHYSPNAELLLFAGPFEVVTVQMRMTIGVLLAQGKRVGVLTLDEEKSLFDNPDAGVLSLGSKNDLNQVGHNLFAALRALDEQAVDVILVRMFEPEGLGAAIGDRLLRAADGKVIRAE